MKSVTAPTRTKTPRRSMSITLPPSLLDVHDLLDDQGAGHDHRRSQPEHELPRGVREHWLHVARIDRRDEDEQPDRQNRHDPARQPPLSRERADQAANRLALPNVLDDSLENLGSITAGLALERRDERPEEPHDEERQSERPDEQLNRRNLDVRELDGLVEPQPPARLLKRLLGPLEDAAREGLLVRVPARRRRRHEVGQARAHVARRRTEHGV